MLWDMFLHLFHGAGCFRRQRVTIVAGLTCKLRLVEDRIAAIHESVGSLCVYTVCLLHVCKEGIDRVFAGDRFECLTCSTHNLAKDILEGGLLMQPSAIATGQHLSQCLSYNFFSPNLNRLLAVVRIAVDQCLDGVCVWNALIESNHGFFADVLHLDGEVRQFMADDTHCIGCRHALTESNGTTLDFVTLLLDPTVQVRRHKVAIICYLVLLLEPCRHVYDIQRV